MLLVRRSADRGFADHGWLQTHHTFSFGHYHDPDHMGFGVLRVLNQDRVAPGQGFGTHGHRDMEIVSYVLEGVLEHKDSMGNGSKMRPGEVQLMSAGRGVTHSEFNASGTEPLHFLQMWILPRERGTEPRYEQKEFPDVELRSGFRLVVSPDGASGSLTIAQDARLYASRLPAGEQTKQTIARGRQAWLHVVRGRAQLGEFELGPGDGVAIRDESEWEFAALDETECVLWEMTDA